MSHAQLVGELAAPLRVLLQPAGSAEKKLITLAHNNYVAELRAEVHAYWQQSQQQQQQAQQQSQQSQQSQQQGSGQRLCGPAGDGLSAATEPAQLRIISQGTELTPDCDDKLLTDVGFKDMQVGQELWWILGITRAGRSLLYHMPRYPFNVSASVHNFRGMHCLYHTLTSRFALDASMKLLILSFFSSSELLSKNSFNKSKFGLSMLSIFVRSSDIWYKPVKAAVHWVRVNALSAESSPKLTWDAMGLRADSARLL